MVPTGTGNQGKPGKWEGREFYPKYWKNQKKLHWKIERNTGKVREICQRSNIENPANMVTIFAGFSILLR